MAEKKKTITRVESDGTATAAKRVEATGSDTGYRIGAILCWVVAIAAEIIACCIAFGKINWTFASTLVQLIIFVVVDLVFLIIGSTLWKKANHINPASEKNAFLYSLQNNLGSFMAILCFAPLIIIILTSKNEKMDKKTKTFACIAAVVALLVGGVIGIDFNPVSEEQLASAEEYITEEVFWTKAGKVYHLDDDCQALNRSDELFTGEVAAAIENGKTRLCKFCAKKHSIDGSVATDEN